MEVAEGKVERKKTEQLLGVYVFLSAFAKMRNANTSFVMCVCPSASPSVRFVQPVRIAHLGSHWTVFNEILYSTVFRKSVHKIQNLLKRDKNIGTLREDQCTHMILYRLIILKNKKCFRQLFIYFPSITSL